ncbi:MAG: cyclase family protein [Desulfarculus sp.]|jgi:kynurenine formamidase|nr:MAG: cyclase family protein [Desulfarculus sp.]
MDPAKIRGLVKTGQVFDLGMDYYVGMPHHPVHPPFAFSLIKMHGDMIYEKGVSSSNCLFTTGGHTGTHMDALGHFSHQGRVHGVGDIEPWQDHHGLRKAGIDQAAPVVTRGVLLDIAGLEGVECLGHDYRIGVQALQGAAQRQGVAVEAGDAVLLRTGWIKYFDQPRLYIAHEEGCPGLVEEGARWLVARGAAHVGSDTVALEKTPTANYPVHIILLVENGIHILEALNLEELAAARTYEFLFMVSPLKIRGGTASPVRPLAVA